VRYAILMMTVGLAFGGGRLQAGPPQQPPPDVGAGRVGWFDIATTDLAKSREFYGELFDWTFTAVEGTDQAIEIVSGDQSIGTIRVAEGAISAFNGVVYVQVNDIQASCKRATELGGTVEPGFPFDLPGRRGAVALLTDPTGHPVGMFSRTPLASPPPPPE
jgi:predicted enzyme related to lactoylglutathione lyase